MIIGALFCCFLSTSATIPQGKLQLEMVQVVSDLTENFFPELNLVSEPWFTVWINESSLNREVLVETYVLSSAGCSLFSSDL